MKMVKRAFAAGVGPGCSGSGPAMAAWSDLNLRVGVTELSREIYGLHMLILWICVAIAAAVFGVMIYSIATFRHSKGAVPATFDHNTKRRGHLDGDPGADPGGHGGAGGQDAGQDRRYAAARSSPSR